MSNSSFSTSDRTMKFGGVKIDQFPLDPNRVDPGQASDWTFYNRGNTSLTRYENNSTLSFLMPSAGGAGTYRNRGFYKAIPSTASVWTHICQFTVLTNVYGASESSSPRLGIGVRSSADEVLFFCINPWNGFYRGYYCATNTSAPNLQVSSDYYIIAGDSFTYWKMTNDGIDNRFYISQDGNAWLQVATLALGVMTNQVSYGFFGSTGDGTTLSKIMTVSSSRFYEEVI